ncbi:hypothetical protein GCM10022223_42660 [Kineosporia mesophila]|uniref:Uncharacterized protein n=1 Tax=Kineosporia mesophila TaxID=566012 RepID=A0ABP6ZZU1_9ACTN
MSVSEITRPGSTQDDTSELAHIIAALLGEQEPVDELDRRLDEMSETHREVVLSFSVQFAEHQTDQPNVQMWSSFAEQAKRVSFRSATWLSTP